jgi:hypothetical protein
MPFASHARSSSAVNMPQNYCQTGAEAKTSHTEARWCVKRHPSAISGWGRLGVMEYFRSDPDLTAFLYQRERGYCIGMISSRWCAKGAHVCGAGGL